MPLPALPLAELPQVCVPCCNCHPALAQPRLLQTLASLIPSEPAFRNPSSSPLCPMSLSPIEILGPPQPHQQDPREVWWGTPFCMPGSSHQPPGPQASSAPDMARGGGDLLSHGMRLNTLYPPCPGSRHSQILCPTQSKHVANVLSEYVSRRGGQETEPETHSEDESEGVSPENCLGTSADQGRWGGQCWLQG